ncbi:glycosyltransferase [Parasynechococcus sp.]|uniref:glycosyltransferase n=1 Tax=Parasynechococcus sp. TaxID=3101203 RepID=UPI0037040158
MKSQQSHRLVLVLPYLKARGTEKQALMLSQGLVSLGWEVSLVVVMGYGESWLYEALEQTGVKVFNLGPPWHRERKGVSWLRLPHLVRYLMLLKPDVVMSRALLANRFVGFASMIACVPFLATYSGGISPPEDVNSRSRLSSWNSRLQEVIWRVLQGWPAKLVTVSGKSAEHLYRRFPHSLKWVIPIPNGVACSPLPENYHQEQKSARAQNYVRIVFVGSIELVRKGLDVLIDAVEILVQESAPLFRLTIVGDGPDLSLLKDLVISKGLNLLVEFWGESENPLDVMRQSDLLVLPSRREGLPNVMLEAMSCGVCVIASSCPVGPSEVISHRESGWLVRVGDSVALAKGMRTLISDSVLREQLAQAGFSYVSRQCSAEVMTQRYDSVLSSLKGSAGLVAK